MMKGLKYSTIVIGGILMAIGLWLSDFLINPQGIMVALPYVCVGLGCGIFGHGMGNLISDRAVKGHPEVQKQFAIDKNDERNVQIANCAKAKAFDMMTFVNGALLVSFALMGVDMIVILVMVFAYLFVHGYGVYYRFKYDKEM
ncbi:DUF6442 family protein [Eubacteriaceae bacterium ES2]|nr:DUF6442 family protein [Eubacteriaceae bacterium ES2]